MITRIKNLPKKMVGFLATKEVTTTDFIEKVMPEVEKFIEEKDRLNYKLVIETDLSRFTSDAWFQDAILEIKNTDKWYSAAFVFDPEFFKIYMNS